MEYPGRTHEGRSRAKGGAVARDACDHQGDGRPSLRRFRISRWQIQSAACNMAFLMLLRRIGRSGLTAHGFRSTFRDWAAERTSFPAEVAEMALAHAVGEGRSGLPARRSLPEASSARRGLGGVLYSRTGRMPPRNEWPTRSSGIGATARCCLARCLAVVTMLQ